MKAKILFIVLMIVVLVGCTRETESISTSTPTPTQAPTPTLAQPQMDVTSVPDVKYVARNYLDTWIREDYPAMYAMLTAISHDALTAEEFETVYRSVAAEAALSGWEYEILSALTNPRSAQVAYRVTLHSALVGDIERETTMNLSLEQAEWKVQWDEALILPELRGGNYLKMEYRVPARANIYDRAGRALVAQTDAVAIGLNTSAVDPAYDNALLSDIYRLTGIHPANLRPQLENYRQYGWYLPVADVSAEDMASFSGSLGNYAGVILQPFRGRYYFDEGVAPHVVGYVSAIQQEEIEYYKRLGYNVWSDRVGQMGVEAWGEQYLAGKRGGVLYLVGPDGGIITRLAESNPEPPQSIYTTLDRTLQSGAQAALGDFRGAVVVLERDTGRVLALASSPGFNPNLFEPQNYNYSFLINDLFDQERLPLMNRATQGQYPLGSVFKIITMAAGLETGMFTPESQYNCEYFFNDLSGVTLHDWTYDHYLEDGKTQASGLLTLPQGLMRSCNPWFWHIGLSLFVDGQTTAISDMARAFGLGSKTGIEIPENPGSIPDPGSQLDATNLAIGQGGTLVTPLQVAAFVAAVGNGGVLYEPKVIEKISTLDGNPTYVFTSTVRATLPITGADLAVIQSAMVNVVSNPRGTAYFVLNSFSNSNGISVAGKTGTAESGVGEPHAWFAGYTFSGRENKPDIAVAVVLEMAGEGSEMAAPIFKRVLEIYFLGRPQTRYPWEAQIGVVATPTSDVSPTPRQETEQTPAP